MGQLFDRDDFAAEREELRELLNEKQYAAARLSTLNAHYTDAALVQAIWDGVQRLGFRGGDVLEPGCGSGHFIGLAPETARMTGVEREPISAAIAAELYPHASVIADSFAKLDAYEGSFDCTVGNVPFAKVKLPDRKHNPGRQYSIHNHFIIKALRLTRPGGVVALLTSRLTMDALNPAARAEMAQLADLIGAVRLPAGAHRRAAGTEAITDLLILRRRAEDEPETVSFSTWEKALPIALGNNGKQVRINTYFHSNPDHVLGDFALSHGSHQADELTVRGDLSTVAAQFAETVARITDKAAERGLQITARSEVASRSVTLSHPSPTATRLDGFITANADGTFSRQVGDTSLPHTPPAAEAHELRALLQIRDLTRALLNEEHASIDDTSLIADLRTQLNAAYDTYVSSYGPLSRYTLQRTMRAAWHVFSEWCDKHDLQKTPASADIVVAYLDILKDQGLGQDQLQRHLDGIVGGHNTAYKLALKKGARLMAATELGRKSGRQVSELAANLLSEQSPESLLLAAQIADPRLSPAVIAAGQRIVDAAPETTDPELDLDALGLRTTRISAPPQGGFRTDPLSSSVRVLESFDPATQTANKADIFTQRVVHPPRSRLGAETAEEAISICLDSHSRIDLAEITRLLGLPGETEARAALSGQVFNDPVSGELIWKPFYLAGNVREKLAQARTAAASDPAFDENVTALSKVIPADVGPIELQVRLGSWIGPHYVQQFLAELLNDNNVRVETVAGLWLVETDRTNLSKATELAAKTIWGAGGQDAYKLTEMILIGEPIKIMKAIIVTGADGKEREKWILDRPATEAAIDKAAEISDRFTAWIWSDTSRARAVLREYNDRYNAEVPVDYSGIELSLPGLSTAYDLKTHQIVAAARMIYQGGTGLVHEVGAGKTLEIIVGTMERRRRGLATTPVIVVPNDSIADQFEREWLRAYPLASLHTALSSDVTTDTKKGIDRRAAFVAGVAVNNYDAVIMTKESFQRIPLPPEISERFLRLEMEELFAAKKSQAETMSKTMTKRIEQAIESAKARLEARLEDIERDVKGMTFVDAGFDYIVVDEAQTYKNGLIISQIPDLAIPGADRSIDLDMKLYYLQGRFGSARVTLATATPWTNKFSEVYLWERRLGHTLPRFDTWARTYLVPETYNEMSPAGTLRPKTRPRGFINQPELWRALRLTADIKMKADLHLNTPRLRGGREEIIEVPASEEVRILTLDAARRERNLSGEPEKGQDNHLVILHDGQLMALDTRAVGVTTSAAQKVDYLADDIVAEWEAAKDNVYLRSDGSEHPVRGGLILVFCDQSVPSRRHWNFYDELRSQLVRRGMGEKSVRFVHEATNPQRKAALLNDAREGAVSVLIGSTMKMGAGINIQTRALGGYMVTFGWRADIIAQAKGRIERQGNQNAEFFWKSVALAPSMDAKKVEITLQKSNMFAPLYQNTVPERHREVPNDEIDSLAELMAAATGDPRYREKAELDAEYKTLARQRSAHVGTQQQLMLSIATSQARIPELLALAERQDSVAATMTDTRGDAFVITIGEQIYTSRNEAAEELRSRLAMAMAKAPIGVRHREVPLGSLAGLEFTAVISRYKLDDVELDITFPGATENSSGIPLNGNDLPDGRGLVTRLENHLKRIAAAGDSSRAAAAEEQATIDKAKEAVGQKFPGERRLAEVVARRADIITQLSDVVEVVGDPDEDPNSPEAKQRARVIAERNALRATLREKAQDAAEGEGLSRSEATVFSDWYAAICDNLPPHSQPRFPPAITVWRAIGAPGADGRTRLAPLRTYPAAEADNAPLTLPSGELESSTDIASVSAGNETPRHPAANNAQTSIDPLPVHDLNEQWEHLQQEVLAVGMRHERRNGVGSGHVDLEGREVLTDAGRSLAEELLALADHVYTLREHHNRSDVVATVDRVLAHDAADTREYRAHVLTLLSNAGMRATSWVIARLSQAAALKAIAETAAAGLAGPLRAPKGTPILDDSHLRPWQNYTAAPLTRGDVEIRIDDLDGLGSAALTVVGSKLPSYRVRLPAGAGTARVDTIIRAIDTASSAAAELREQMIRELARTRPLSTQTHPTHVQDAPHSAETVNRAFVGDRAEATGSREALPSVTSDSAIEPRTASSSDTAASHGLTGQLIGEQGQQKQTDGLIDPRPAPDALNTDHPPLLLPGGRELAYSSDMRSSAGGSMRFPERGYQRLEPGRFRIRISRTPTEVDSEEPPWSWTVAQVNEAGQDSGAYLHKHDRRYRTAQDALRAAAPYLQALERFIDQPTLVAGPAAPAPIGEMVFVPGWGDVLTQLTDAQYHIEGLNTSVVWTAVTAAKRLASGLPEMEANWILQRSREAGQDDTDEQATRTTVKHLYELAGHIVASGLPEHVKHARGTERLSELLRTTAALVTARLDTARNAAATRATEQPETTELSPGDASEAAQPHRPGNEGEAAEREPGVWSQRIQIIDDGVAPLVTGTVQADPRELRDALRENGFRYGGKLENYGWRYRPHEGVPSREEAVDNLRRHLRWMDSIEAAYAATQATVETQAPTHPPTSQQRKIMDDFSAGLTIAVRALAGTGKTTLLRMLAGLVPDMSIIYVAFNRSIADEAQRVFTNNVTANTLHGFARADLSNDPELRAKLKNIAPEPPGFKVAELLGYDEEAILVPADVPEGGYTALRVVNRAMAVVKKFRESADERIGPQHLPNPVETPGAATLDSSALVIAEQIWNDKVSSTGVLPFTHDDYLKIWALKKPTLSCDVIFFDEAQDCNAVQADIVQSQGKQTVVVGDSYQSIYGFRGARDFLTTWPVDAVRELTQSWRFGTTSADVGNAFLRLLDAPLTLQGTPQIDTRFGSVDQPDAVLCRTNARAVAEVLIALEAKKRVALVGGGKEISRIAEAARTLQAGRRTSHEELSMFLNWHHVRNYVDDPETGEDANRLRTFVKLVDSYRPDGLIRLAKQLSREDEQHPFRKPDLIVATAHRAKGLEFATVRIANDFRKKPDVGPDGTVQMPDPEELRLYYVAVTRGMHRVDLGSLAWIWDYVEPLPDHNTTPNADAPTPPIDDKMVTNDTAVASTSGISRAKTPAVNGPQPQLATQPKLTARMLHELAHHHSLAVTAVRVGRESWLTVHEPGAAGTAVLSWHEPDEPAFTASGTPLAPDMAEQYLQRYRNQIFGPAAFTVPTTVPDWPRRLAQLVPHLTPGEHASDVVAEAVHAALTHVDRGDRDQAAHALRHAEAAAGPLLLGPARRAQLIRAITDYACGYRDTGDPARYLTETNAYLPHGGTRREWDWATTYIADHPAVLNGHPDTKGIVERDTNDRDVVEAASTELSKAAKHALNNADPERALDLLHDAYRTFPERLRDWSQAFDQISQAIADGGGRPPSPPPGPPTPRNTTHDGIAIAEDHLQRHAQINALAADWFDAQLDDSAPAQEYLRSRLGSRAALDRVRARTPGDANRLRIGYAPTDWSRLSVHLQAHGFSENDLINAGISRRSSRGTLIDFFRGRIIFTIHDLDGRPAGFIGRDMAGLDTTKYLNTHNEAPLYDKSRLVLGLYEQRERITAGATPSTVEGPFDILAMLAQFDPARPQAGISACGVAFGAQHFAALDTVIAPDARRGAGFDPDSGGLKALRTTIEPVLGTYPNLHITQLPDGMDPAEYALTGHDLVAAFHGPPLTRPAPEVLIELRLSEFGDRLGRDGEVEANIAAAHSAAQVLARLPLDRRAELSSVLAARLDMYPDVLAEIIDSTEKRHSQRPADPAAPQTPTSTAEPGNTEVPLHPEPSTATPENTTSPAGADPVLRKEADLAGEPGVATLPGPWLLAPVAEHFDEQTPLTPQERAATANQAYDALAATITTDVLVQLGELAGHEALDWLLQADRLEAIAQAVERAAYDPLVLLDGDTEQRLDPEQIDGAITLLARKPHARLTLRCADLTIGAGTDDHGTFLLVEPGTWRGQDEQPWADRVRLPPSAATTVGLARHYLQQRMNTTRARATAARGRLYALLGSRRVGDTTTLRHQLAQQAARLGPLTTRLIGDQLARIDLLRQIAAVAATANPAPFRQGFTMAGDLIDDPGALLAAPRPEPGQEHLSPVLRWRDLDINTRWAPDNDTPTLYVAPALPTGSGSTRRALVSFALDAAWFTTPGQSQRIVDYLARCVANAELLALTTRRKVETAIGAPQREQRQRADAAAEQTEAARQYAAQHSTLVIEHNHSATTVHGSTNEDTALHELLHEQKFRYSSRMRFWYQPRRWSYGARNRNVQALVRALTDTNRAHEVWDHEVGTPEEPPPPLPAAEPLTSHQQLISADRDVRAAYHAVTDTAAGRRLLAPDSDRPDAKALRAAATALTVEPLADGLSAAARRHTAVFHAATRLHRNLLGDRKNAPRLMQRLTTLITTSGTLAAQLTALSTQHPDASLPQPAEHETTTSTPPTPPQPAQLDMVTAGHAEPSSNTGQAADAVPAPPPTPASAPGESPGQLDPRAGEEPALPEYITLADRAMGGGWSNIREVLQHWRTLPNPHPDGDAADSWTRGRDELMHEVANSRRTLLSPGGALLAYLVPGRRDRWAIVHTATGHPIVAARDAAVPQHPTPAVAQDYTQDRSQVDTERTHTVLILPRGAVPDVLRALETAVSPDGAQIDWTDHASMLRTAAQWRLTVLHGKYATADHNDNETAVGLRHLHAAALLYAAAHAPDEIAGSEAFAKVLWVTLPSVDAAAARYHRMVAVSFSFLSERLAPDAGTWGHRDKYDASLDPRTRAVVRLAAAYTFTGHPHLAVRMLRERASEIEIHDERRHRDYQSHSLWMLADDIADQFSPAATELERLLAAKPGDHIVATDRARIRVVDPDITPQLGATWRITGPIREDLNPPRPDLGPLFLVPVDRLDPAGPVHGLINIHPSEVGWVRIDYDQDQRDHSLEQTWEHDLLSSVAHNRWAVVAAGEPVPDTVADVLALSRRAQLAFAAEAPEAHAGPAEDLTGIAAAAASEQHRNDMAEAGQRSGASAEDSASKPETDLDTAQRTPADQIELPSLTEHQKAKPRDTYLKVFTKLAAASFTLLRREGIGLPGSLDLSERTVTIDPSLPAELQTRCLLAHYERVRDYRTQLGAAATAALQRAPAGTAYSHAADMIKRATELDWLADAVAKDGTRAGEYDIPASSSLLQHLAAHQVEGAMATLALAAAQGTSPQEALARLGYVVGPKSTCITWNDLTLTFNREHDQLMLDITTANGRGRDRIPIPADWINNEHGRHIHTAFKQRVASFAANADRLRDSALHSLDPTRATEQPHTQHSTITSTTPAHEPVATPPRPTESPTLDAITPESLPASDPNPADRNDEADIEAAYTAEGLSFLRDPIVDLNERFRHHHWTLVESGDSEIGELEPQVWQRHDVALSLARTPDGRVTDEVRRLVGAWDDWDWDTLTLDSVHALLHVIEHTGLYGVARPTSARGTWRVEHTDTQATPAAVSDPRARQVTRAANAANSTWLFADTGEPVPLAPRPPKIDITDRKSLLAHILDGNQSTTVRDLASLSISRTTRKGVAPTTALDQLRGHDIEIYRRAFVARAGAPLRRGQAYDFDRARLALHRLAERDPSLPINAIGEYVEITVDEPQPADADGWIPADRSDVAVRGVVVDVKNGYHPRECRLIVQRDVPAVDGAPAASTLIAVDDRLTVLDPALRPGQNERTQALEDLAPAIAHRRQALHLDDDIGPTADTDHHSEPTPQQPAKPATDTLNTANSVVGQATAESHSTARASTNAPHDPAESTVRDSADSELLSDTSGSPVSDGADARTTRSEEHSELTLFDVAPAAGAAPIGIPAHVSDVTQQRRAPTPPAGEAYRRLFEYGVELGEAALADARAAGGHDPTAWLNFSYVVCTDPATGQQYGAIDTEQWTRIGQWWIDHAAAALAEFGYTVHELPPPGRAQRRKMPAEIDTEQRRIVIDTSRANRGNEALAVVAHLARLRSDRDRVQAAAETSTPLAPIELTDDQIDEDLGLIALVDPSRLVGRQLWADSDRREVLNIRHVDVDSVPGRWRLICSSTGGASKETLAEPGSWLDIHARQLLTAQDGARARERWHRAARTMAANGYLLRHSHGPARLTFPLHTRFMPRHLPLPEKLERAEWLAHGSSIPTTTELDGHPAVRAVRDAIARCPKQNTTQDYEVVRGLAAVDAASSYYPAPGDADLRTLADLLHILVRHRGPATWALPRWVDLVPEVTWTWWADTLHHTARVIDAAEPNLQWVSWKLRDAATELRARTRALEHTRAEELLRIGPAGATFVPADHPAALPLHDLLDGGHHTYAAIPTFLEAEATGRPTLAAAKRALREPAATPEDTAERIAHDSSMGSQSAPDLLSLAARLREAKYTDLVGDPPLPRPDHGERAAHLLNERTHRSDADAIDSIVRDWMSFESPPHEDPVARAVRRVAEEISERKQRDTAAKKAVSNARYNIVESIETHSSLLMAREALDQAEVAVQRGDRDSACLHLANWITRVHEPLSPRDDKGLISLELRRVALGWAAPTREWIARAIPHGKAETVVATLATWAADLKTFQHNIPDFKQRNAKKDAKSQERMASIKAQLSEVLRGIDIDTIADGLLAQATAIGDRHQVTVPTVRTRATPKPAHTSTAAQLASDRAADAPTSHAATSATDDVPDTVADPAPTRDTDTSAPATPSAAESFGSRVPHDEQRPNVAAPRDDVVNESQMWQDWPVDAAPDLTDAKQWRHTHLPDNADAARAHNALLDLLTPEVVAALPKQTRGELARCVQNSYQANLLAAAVAQARTEQAPLQLLPDHGTASAQADNPEHWNNHVGALVDDTTPHAQIRWGRLVFAVDQSSAQATAVIGTTSQDSEQIELIARVPLTSNSGPDTKPGPFGQQVRAAVIPAASHALLARLHAHDILDRHGLTPVAAARRYLEASPTPRPDTDDLHRELRKLTGLTALAQTVALSRVHAAALGHLDEAEFIDTTDGDAPVADPGAVLADPALLTSPPRESRSLTWHHLQVHTAHNGRHLELVLRNSDEQDAVLVTHPLSTEQFTPDGLLTTLHTVIASAEQQILQRASALARSFDALPPTPTTAPDPELPNRDTPSATPTQSNAEQLPTTALDSPAGTAPRLARLTASDVAQVVQQVVNPHLAHFLGAVRHADADVTKVITGEHEWHPDQPDTRARVAARHQGLEISFESADQRRTGRLSWTAIYTWLRAGFDPQDLRIVRDAATSTTSLTHALAADVTHDAAKRGRAAIDLLAMVALQRANAITDRALAVYAAGGQPEPWASHHRDPRLQIADDDQLSAHHQDLLRIIADAAQIADDLRTEPLTEPNTTTGSTPEPEPEAPAASEFPSDTITEVLTALRELSWDDLAAIALDDGYTTEIRDNILKPSVLPDQALIVIPRSTAEHEHQHLLAMLAEILVNDQPMPAPASPNTTTKATPSAPPAPATSSPTPVATEHPTDPSATLNTDDPHLDHPHARQEHAVDADTAGNPSADTGEAASAQTGQPPSGDRPTGPADEIFDAETWAEFLADTHPDPPLTTTRGEAAPSTPPNEPTPGTPVGPESQPPATTRPRTTNEPRHRVTDRERDEVLTATLARFGWSTSAQHGTTPATTPGTAAAAEKPIPKPSPSSTPVVTDPTASADPRPPLIPEQANAAVIEAQLRRFGWLTSSDTDPGSPASQQPTSTPSAGSRPSASPPTRPSPGPITRALELLGVGGRRRR